jgi:hypothetical protein
MRMLPSVGLQVDGFEVDARADERRARRLHAPLDERSAKSHQRRATSSAEEGEDDETRRPEDLATSPSDARPEELVVVVELRAADRAEELRVLVPLVDRAPGRGATPKRARKKIGTASTIHPTKLPTTIVFVGLASATTGALYAVLHTSSERDRVDEQRRDRRGRTGDRAGIPPA